MGTTLWLCDDNPVPEGLPGPAGGAGRDVPHGLEEALDQVGRGGVWTLGETSLHTHHDRVSLPAVVTVEYGVNIIFYLA